MTDNTPRRDGRGAVAPRNSRQTQQRSSGSEHGASSRSRSYASQDVDRAAASQRYTRQDAQGYGARPHSQRRSVGQTTGGRSSDMQRSASSTGRISQGQASRMRSSAHPSQSGSFSRAGAAGQAGQGSYRQRSSSRPAPQQEGSRSGTQARSVRAASSRPSASRESQPAGQGPRSSRSQQVAASQRKRPVAAGRTRKQGAKLGSSGLLDRRQFSAGMVAAGAGAVALAVGGGVMFSRRAVACEINGAECKVANHSSVQSLIDKGFAKPKYGNLVDVAGELMEAGKGERYTVSVNGVDLGQDIDKYRLKAGDKLVFTDGIDKMEEHESQKTEIPFNWVKAKGVGAITFISQWGKPGYSEVLVGKQSGKTVKRDQAEAPQNRVITSLNIEPKDGEKIVAITFDDGPSEYTLQMLPILEQYGAKCTFFDVGNAAKMHPDIIGKVLAAGHEVGCHTMTHPQLPKISPERVKEEITQGMYWIRQAGSKSKLFRAPYGAFGTREWTILNDDISCLCGWNLDSLDWSPKTSEGDVISKTTKLMKPGSVILCHAGGGKREKTVSALPSILKAWTDAGYRFVTMTELLKSDERCAPILETDSHLEPMQLATPESDHVYEATASGAVNPKEREKVAAQQQQAANTQGKGAQNQQTQQQGTGM